MKRVEDFNEAIRRKYPSPITLCSCVGSDGKPNIITLGWEMQTSIEPKMFAVSIDFRRHSYRLIEDSGEFVIAYPSEDMAEAAMLCGTKSGRDIDKFAETGLEALPASVVKAPLIGGCLANMECVVRGKLETGDHAIFAGEVVAAHVDESNTRGRLMALEKGVLGGVRII